MYIQLYVYIYFLYHLLLILLLFWFMLVNLLSPASTFKRRFGLDGVILFVFIFYFFSCFC